ncbi:S8 family serine peptidase [Paenibacillus sp. N3.4]|uniref:S8 family peptidase n=1 Tax=Paenibacillus sp. N3.4 TaxID=2603222 RepID=UPI0011CA391C|nr:S8 family serine peptidase [Paenibacillus sp. N3.4]TXK82619.1 S8 family serine peptidase [Paenibacillus sp. N3.4]
MNILKIRFRAKYLMLGVLAVSIFINSGINQVNAEVMQPSIDPIHANVDESLIVPGQVIVKYKSTTRGRSLMGESISSVGSQRFYNVHFSEDVSVAQKMSALQSDPDIEYVEPVFKVKITDPPSNSVTASVYTSNDLTYMKNWGKTVTELTYAAEKTTVTQHAAVTVAVIDTGVDLTHPDLIHSIVQGYDFIHNQSNAQDDNGHGTNVAGIIAAKAHDTSGYSGVAPGAKIMPIKVLDSKGGGNTATIIQGIQYAIDHHADIINLSLGSSIPSRAMQELLRSAFANNILIVAAAGNDSNHWINNEVGQLDDPQKDTHRYAFLSSYPAAFQDVVSVGAIEQLVDSRLTIADFSNVGKIDVVAPGVNIYSTYLNGGYGYMSGTSQATPFVVGYAALLKAYNPNLTSDDLKSIISTMTKGNLLDTNHQYNYENFNAYEDEAVTFEMDYGRGLINGRLAFEIPRPKLSLIQDTISQDRKITLKVTVEDLSGHLLTYPYPISINSRLFKENIPSREFDFSAEGSTVDNLNNGFANISIALNEASPKDVYHYYYFAEMLDANNYQRRSNYVHSVRKPVAPTASLASGTYTGTQKISLSTTQSGADIFALLVEGNKVRSGKVLPGAAIEIKGPNSFLSVYSEKNYVDSDFSEYVYNIKPAPVGGGGGGFMPSPTTDKVETVVDGKKILELKEDKNKLLERLRSSKESLDLDATSEKGFDKLSVELPGEVAQKAVEANLPIVIKSNGFQATFNPKGVLQQNTFSKLQFKAELIKKENYPIDMGLASSVYDFAIEIDGTKISSFNAPIEMKFNLDAKNSIHDAKKVGVFYFNEATRSWEYVGGTLNNDQTIKVQLSHFSKYAVLEYSKSFSDINKHWAQNEIETMASKQIVNGITDSSFEPEANITRAQFVTLLSKALRLPNSSTETLNPFSDVSSKAWYKDVILAAHQAHLIDGISDDQFAPDLTITREQMAVMIVNAYLYATGKSLADIQITQEQKYDDEGTISEYARQSVRIANSFGLMKGATALEFSPMKVATRAQAAVVIFRMLEQIK